MMKTNTIIKPISFVTQILVLFIFIASCVSVDESSEDGENKSPLYPIDILVEMSEKIKKCDELNDSLSGFINKLENEFNTNNRMKPIPFKDEFNRRTSLLERDERYYDTIVYYLEKSQAVWKGDDTLRFKYSAPVGANNPTGDGELVVILDQVPKIEYRDGQYVMIFTEAKDQVCDDCDVIIVEKYIEKDSIVIRASNHFHIHHNRFWSDTLSY